MKLVQDSTVLELSQPGRAIFQVLSPQMLAGTVQFFVGWHWDSQLTLFFTGDIDPKLSTRVDDKQVRLCVREASARMQHIHPMALRHPTLKEVLAEYAKAAKVQFIVPEKGYATTKVPAFYAVGSGTHGLANMGDVFHIPDYVWLTQGDGKIFVGSHADCRWAKITGLDLPDNFYHSARADGTRSVTAVPSLRPGAVLNGERVRMIKLTGHTMEISICNKA